MNKNNNNNNNNKMCLLTIIFDNILRLFDVLPNFPFTTSEAKRDY